MSEIKQVEVDGESWAVFEASNGSVSVSNSYVSVSLPPEVVRLVGHVSARQLERRLREVQGT